MSKELLKSLLGELYTDAIGQKLADKELAVVNDGSYIPRQKYTDEVKDLKGLLKDRDKQLTELQGKAAGNEALQAQIQKLQDDNKTATESYDKKVAQLQFEHTVEKALSGAKVKNPKAVKALLDLEKIKLDGEKLLGFDDQIKALQTSDAYLFGEVTQVGGGTNPPGGSGNAGSSNAGMNDFIRSAAGKV